MQHLETWLEQELIQPLLKPGTPARVRNVQATLMVCSRLLHRLGPVVDAGLAQVPIEALLRNGEPIPRGQLDQLGFLVCNVIALSRELRA